MSGTGEQFASDKLKWLVAFDVSNNGGGDAPRYVRPVFQDMPEVTHTNYTRSVADAFNAAPGFFKQELCSLNYVFIDPQPRTPFAWGFWEAQTQDPRQFTFVGLSTELWTGNRLRLSRAEDLRLSALLNDDWDKWPDRPAYIASVDTPAVGLLSTLAHEVGHILWRNGDGVEGQVCDPRREPRQDRRRWSWPRFEKHPPNQRFRAFGVEFPRGTTSPNGEARRDIDFKNKPNTVAQLRRIYSSGLWASLLATVAPDEDFSETYKLIVLQGTGTRLALQKTTDGDGPRFTAVVSDHLFADTTLSAKAECIKRIYGIQ